MRSRPAFAVVAWRILAPATPKTRTVVALAFVPIREGHPIVSGVHRDLEEFYLALGLKPGEHVTEAEIDRRLALLKENAGRALDARPAAGWLGLVDTQGSARSTDAALSEFRLAARLLAIENVMSALLILMASRAADPRLELDRIGHAILAQARETKLGSVDAETSRRFSIEVFQAIEAILSRARNQRP